MLKLNVNKTNKTILIIEDEPDIRTLLEFNLKKNGYSILLEKNGEDGLTSARNSLPDLILLDLMLPGINGIDVCRLLKSDDSTRDIPIIMLTALGQEEDIVQGLEAGSDDYVTKPFSLKVLEARIAASIRKYTNKKDGSNQDIRIQGIKMSNKTRDVKIDNVKIELTFTEFQILHLLASHPGWVFTRYQIIERIRGDGYPVTDRSVDFQIVGLRKKMKNKGKLIETIRGVGYRFHYEET